jgi:hypothetical protein
MEKERIEKAIETINGLIMDFTDAVDGLRDVRELLYELSDSEKIIMESADPKTLELATINARGNI